MSVDLPPFQWLLDQHRDDVYRFLVATVGAQEADDCFQETFMAALRAYPRLRDASNLRSWLLTIAHRKAIDSARSRARQPMPVEDVPDAAAPAASEVDERLWQAVRTLPDKQRGAVLLHYVSDLAHAQVARILECSEEAARRSAHEGIKKLRQEWQP